MNEPAVGIDFSVTRIEDSAALAQRQALEACQRELANVLASHQKANAEIAACEELAADLVSLVRITYQQLSVTIEERKRYRDAVVLIRALTESAVTCSDGRLIVSQRVAQIAREALTE